jgi:hypothetical protein
LQSSHRRQCRPTPKYGGYEEGVEFPRSFEVSDIPIGYNFTVRAWIDLPQDQPSNGTVWVNTTVRSQFQPSTEFVHTSTGDYTGVPWQEEVEEESFDLFGMISTGFDVLKAWSLMIGAILFSGVVIYKSVVARNQRTIEQMEMDALNQPKPQEAVGDWMNRFAPSEPKTVQESSLEVNPEHFKQAFQRRSGGYKEAKAPVDASLTKAATTVLEHHSSNDLLSSADSLLADIQVKPRPSRDIETSALQPPPPQVQTSIPAQQRNTVLPIDDDLDI